MIGPQKHRFAHRLQETAPEHTERVRDAPPGRRAPLALTIMLADAEAAGHNATTLLHQAVGQLDGAPASPER